MLVKHAYGLVCLHYIQRLLDRATSICIDRLAHEVNQFYVCASTASTAVRAGC
jgi:hypothetical protein